MNIKKPILCLVALLSLVSITCNSPIQLFSSLRGESSKINKITFCTDVSDDGKCLEPSSSFPAGTNIVWAYFTFQNMKDGQKWSRVWTQNGAVDVESRDEDWDNGTQGWQAYTLEDPEGLSGHFILTFYIDKDQVQTAAFDVAAPIAQSQTNNIEAENSATEAPEQNVQASFPSFGPITMATDIDENNFPIGPSKVFNEGIKIVYAVFPFSNIISDTIYSVEWIRDGKQLGLDDYNWSDSTEGIHSSSLELNDNAPLVAGNYTLNLYLEKELARSTKFQIQGKAAPAPESNKPAAAPKSGHPDRPATPEETWDARALKYYYMIAQADLPVLKEILNDNLKGWTQVIVTPDNQCGKGAVACFRAVCDHRSDGKVLIPASSLNQADFLVAETLTHELTHGMEWYGGMKCGCTVQKEFYAFAAELDYLGYSGHRDYLFNQYGLLWDKNGNVDTNRLWSEIKKGYLSSTCPEY
ncbi:MAG: hypothetical protein WCG34_07760 [Leptolinea sp.]